MSTGPIDRNGCPNARIESPSTQVTVPVAERTMSPSSSTAATEEPGSRRGTVGPAISGGVLGVFGVEALMEEDAEAPEGASIQPAASAIFDISPPGCEGPEKETGSGSRDIAPADAGSPPRSAESRMSIAAAKCPSRNDEMNDAVGVAAPPIGTGGVGGALRMSSMLWIGVMPQIGSREKGHPYASAPISLAST